MKLYKQNMIEEAAAAKDKTRPILTEPWLDAENKKIIAADGFMLAIVPVETAEGDVSGPITIQALKAGRKATHQRYTDMEIAAGDGSLTTGGVVYPRDMGGNFPNYQRLRDDNLAKRDGDTVWICLDADRLLALARAISGPDSYGGHAVVIEYHPSQLGGFYIRPVHGDGEALLMEFGKPDWLNALEAKQIANKVPSEAKEEQDVAVLS